MTYCSYFVLENSEMIMVSFCQETGFHHKLSSFLIGSLEKLHLGLRVQPQGNSPGSAQDRTWPTFLLTSMLSWGYSKREVKIPDNSLLMS